MIKQHRHSESTSHQTDRLRPSVRIAGYLTIAALVYGALVGANALVGQRLDDLRQTQSATYAQAFSIEANRFRAQDIPQIQAAASDGYEQNLFLTSFERGQLHELVSKHHIAPLAPQPNARLFYCNEGYGLIRYTSDRFGFRNDDSLWDRPQIDAVLIGDSFVQGACVTQAATISGQLHAKGIGTALNLGTGGNGPIHYGALAKTFLPVLKPKYAVFVFVPNDNKDESQSLYRDVFFGEKRPDYFGNTPGQERPSTVSPDLSLLYGQARLSLRIPGNDARLTAAPLVDAPSTTPASSFERVFNELSLGHLRAFIAGIVEQWLPAAPPPWSTRLAIDTALSVCKQEACRPLFVYLPNSDYWSPDARAESYRRSLQSYLSSRVPEGDFIDMSLPIKALGLAGFAPEGRHYSPQGYEAVADALVGAIENH